MTSYVDRRAFLIGPTEIAASVGLEIGPRDAPLVRKAEGEIYYVDFAETEVIKSSQFDPAVRIQDIVDIDIVWNEQPLRQAAGRDVDYILASHVIEHVPDFIGWLAELHDVLKPGGTLGLAVPDARFCFDRYRAESSLSEMIDAYLSQSRRPTVQQVFDASSLSQGVDLQAAWTGALPDEPDEATYHARLPEALKLSRSLLDNPRYVDAHCWVFTPKSFLRLLQLLAKLDLLHFSVDAFRPTEPGSLEFLVRLVNCEPARQAEIETSIEAALASLDAAASAVDAPSDPQLQARSRPRHELQTTLQISAMMLADSQKRIAELEAQEVSLRQQVLAYETSTSWRITAPLRAVAGLLPRGSRHSAE